MHNDHPTPSTSLHEKYWQALFDYAGRAWRGDERAQGRKFLAHFEAVMDRLPNEDRQLLEDFWGQIPAERVQPWASAPRLELANRLTAPGTDKPALGCSGEGWSFRFELCFVLTAPGEVVHALIAHELAHAVLHIQYRRKGLDWPPCPLPKYELDCVFARYRESARHEESLVSAMVARWGFIEEIIFAWQLALMHDSRNPSSAYAKLRMRVLSTPALRGGICSLASPTREATNDVAQAPGSCAWPRWATSVAATSAETQFHYTKTRTKKTNHTERTHDH